MPTLSKGTMRALRLGFLLVAVGLSVWAVAARWDEVVLDLEKIGWLRVLVCVPATAAGLVCGMLAWRSVLGGLGSPLPRRDAARIYFIGQLGKYVPGSVWPVLAQMELGRDHDVPRRRSAGALLVAVVVSLTTGLIVAALTVPFVSGDRHPALWWLLAAVPLLVVPLVPRVLMALLRRVPVLDLGGLHLFVLVGAFPSGGVGPLLIASIGGYPLAWAAGMIAFVLPAGAGARDVTVVLALSAVVPTSAAIAAAVVSRAVTTVCDLALAAVAAVGARNRLRARPTPPPPPEPVPAQH